MKYLLIIVPRLSKYVAFMYLCVFANIRNFWIRKCKSSQREFFEYILMVAYCSMNNKEFLRYFTLLK